MEDMKQSLIDEINKRVHDKILEPSNAQLLIKLIKNAETNDEAINIATLGTTYKRTGLHFDKRLEKINDSIKYFTKNETLSFSTDEKKSTNKLIIGDNYHALQNLLIQYKGRIDVIYIDPPYGKDRMGEFARTNYTNAITRDNLLSMLYPRLILARQLLSNEGVIFCSIDDKNQAYVKCLFDEVFGEDNFVGNLVIQTATDNNPSQINTEHEYILCYAKNLTIQPKWKIQSANAQKIIHYYEKLKKQNLSIEEIQIKLREWIKNHKNELKRVEHYNCVDEKGVYTSNTNSSNTIPGGYTYDILHPITKKPCTKPEFGWRWTEETFWNYAKKNDVDWGKDETTQPHIKKRIETASDTLKSVIYEDGRIATKTLEQIFKSKKIFDNPKPIDLLKRLIQFTTSQSNSEKEVRSVSDEQIRVSKNPSDNSDLVTSNSKPVTILDFFAGSGTTGHAVLDLNRQDGGNRTFILCQINEKTESNPNGIAYDVTSKRLKRIMTGECYDGTKDFPWLKDNSPYGGNLDVYEISSVANFETTQGHTPFDVIDETLYGMEKFSTVKEKIDWVCRHFEKTQKELE